MATKLTFTTGCIVILNKADITVIGLCGSFLSRPQDYVSGTHMSCRFHILYCIVFMYRVTFITLASHFTVVIYALHSYTECL